MRLRWRLGRADAAIHKGELDTAIARLRRAMELADPALKPSLLNRIGILHYNSGRYEEAAAAYREALSMGEMPEVRMNLGNALDRLGRTEEALAEYERARALVPDHPGVLFNIGAYYNGKGRTDEAVECYQASLARMRSKPEAVPDGLDAAAVAMALVQICAVGNKPDVAEGELSELGASGLIEEAEVKNLQAVLLSRTGRLEEAISLYEEILKLKPGFAPPHFNIGMARLRRKEPGKALESFTQFARADAQDPVGEFGLGYAHESLGHPDLALKHYREFIRRSKVLRSNVEWYDGVRGFIEQAEKFITNH